MQVMKMVAEGEMTVEEAMAKVQKNHEDKEDIRNGVARRGAVKKAFRGRLQLSLNVTNPKKKSSTLTVKLAGARDLEPIECNSHVEFKMVPEFAGGDAQQSKTKEDSKHPMYDDTLEWTIPSKKLDLEKTRLVLSVKNQNKRKGKEELLGTMSFSLAEMYSPAKKGATGGLEGWFRVLDEKKGYFQHQIFRPKIKAKDGAKDKKKAKKKKAAGGDDVDQFAVAEEEGMYDIPDASLAAAAGGAKKKKKTTKKKKGGGGGGLKKLSPESFVYTKVLGRGSFGKVMLAEQVGSDAVFAIKVLKKTVVVADDDVAGTMTEKRVLELSEGSPFLTKLHATFQTDAHLYFVMEFVNGGDLMFLIQKFTIFPKPQSQFYTAEILLGLWYLHDNGVIYRDLKLDNVMMSSTGHIKIADFGMCKENLFGGARTTTFCGTPGYLAPEIIYEEPYGAGCDFWSLGVLCYEFLCGDSPFDAEDDDELMDEICNKVVKYPKKLDKDAKSWIERLLDRTPESRIGSGANGRKDIEKHAFFKGMDWSKMEKQQIPPPYVPKIKNPKKAECFDSEFMNEDVMITPLSEMEVFMLEQSEFAGFSFVNPTGELAAKGAGSKKKKKVVNKADLRQFKWYHPDWSRGTVASNLDGTPAGMFCVRESASQHGCYALAMSVGTGKNWNGLITPSDDGTGKTTYGLVAASRFNNIPDLIEFYQKNPIPQGSGDVMLTKAV